MPHIAYNISARHEQQSLLALLSLSHDNLPPALQRVVVWLLQEGTHLPDFSIVELADKAQVSPAAVVRMCQALGFSGFRDFRLRWVREAGHRDVGSQLPPTVPTSIDNVLVQTSELLTVAALQKAAALLLNARQLFIYGSGHSRLIGNLAAKAFSRGGFLTFVFDERDLRDAALELADSDTVVLVISHQGTNPLIEQQVQQDRERGLQIMVMTSNSHSPLACLAHVLIVTGGQGIDFHGALHLPARIAQLVAVEALLETVLKQKNSTQA